MREIKFRAKDKKTGQWRFGQFTRVKKGGCIVPCIAVEKEWDSGDYVEEYEVDGLTLGQHIGLRDSSKKEIYEGDKVILGDDESDLERVVSDFGEVDVDDLGMDFSVTLLKWHLQSSMCGVEVTGNIHQQEPPCQPPKP